MEQGDPAHRRVKRRGVQERDRGPFASGRVHRARIDVAPCLEITNDARDLGGADPDYTAADLLGKKRHRARDSPQLPGP